MVVRGSIVIRASALLTDVYVAGTEIDCTAADEVILLVKYTMGGSETSNTIEIIQEWSDDGGTTYYREALPLILEESQTAGVVDVDKSVITYGADSAAATYDNIAIPIKVLAEKLKVSVKESGVAANAGTCVIRASLVNRR